MRLIAAILCLMLVLALSAPGAGAESVGPQIYEQKDLGDVSLKEFVYSVSADCTAATISVIVMNESYVRESGANTYLKYVDFSSQLMSQMQTGQDGAALLKLPGNVNLMRGMFILVIEKHGFRNKEIHFDLSPCYSNQTKPVKPVAGNTTGSSGNGTTQAQGNGSGTGKQNQTEGTAGQNPESGNKTGNQNGTTGNHANGTSSICPSAALLSALAASGGWLAMRRKGMTLRQSRRYKPFKR
jgi:hypothetical protein